MPTLNRRLASLVALAVGMVALTALDIDDLVGILIYTQTLPAK